MTRQEFLDELRAALDGKVSPETIMDAYRYYSNYIDEEVRKGQPEEAVIEALGKPALISKSIIAASSGERDADVEYTEDGKQRKVRPGKGGSSGKAKEKTEKRDVKNKTFYFDTSAWYVKLFGILLILLMILVVFFLIKVGIIFLVTFGIPILIFLGIIYIIMYFFRE